MKFLVCLPVCVCTWGRDRPLRLMSKSYGPYVEVSLGSPLLDGFMLCTRHTCGVSASVSSYSSEVQKTLLLSSFPASPIHRIHTSSRSPYYYLLWCVAFVLAVAFRTNISVVAYALSCSTYTYLLPMISYNIHIRVHFSTHVSARCQTL